MKSIIAVINQKGGVGKTTTTVNVASYLAKKGSKVLIVDLDPQGNASSGLGITGMQYGAADLMRGTRGIADTIVPVLDNLSIVPSDSQLASLEIELVDTAEREYALKRALADVDHEYVFIDCPPSLSLLTINALTAADNLLIPVQSEYYALEGLSQLLQVVQAVRQSVNPDLDLLGVVMTMHDPRTALSGQVLMEVRKHFGDKVFDTVVPRNVRLAEAPSHGKSIFDHDKWSKGAKAYKNLAKEVHKRSAKKGHV